MKAKISIIVPVHNQAKNIIALSTKFDQAIHSFQGPCDYEIIFINDGSTDNSWELISKLASSNHRIKALNLSRNFGYQNALNAGYNAASGDSIICFDKELHHSPQVIFEIMSQLINSSEKKKVRKSFLNTTVFSLFSKLHLAALKYFAYLGMGIVATGLLILSYFTMDALCFSVNHPLSNFLIIMLYIFIGIQCILLWLINEYCARINQQNNEPLYEINEFANFAFENKINKTSADHHKNLRLNEMKEKHNENR